MSRKICKVTCPKNILHCAPIYTSIRVIRIFCSTMNGVSTFTRMFNSYDFYCTKFLSLCILKLPVIMLSDDISPDTHAIVRRSENAS